MDSVVVHEGDDLPDLYFRIYDQDNTVYMDLSPATTSVAAKFRLKGASTVLATMACAKIAGGLTGLVKLTWGATTLDVTAGAYEIEVAVTVNGKVQTCNRYYWADDEYSDDDTLPVRVKEDF